jgi:tetratricopeptide (TPR) repeat protein
MYRGLTFHYRFGPAWNDHTPSGRYEDWPLVVPLCEWDVAGTFRLPKQDFLSVARDAVGQHKLGLSLYELGKLDPAIAAYQKALRLQPDYVQAYYDLGMAYHGKGMANEAIAAFSDVIRLQPDHSIVCDHVAWLCLDPKIRNPERAVTFAQKAVDLEPQNGTFWQTLGAAQYRAGKWTDSAAALTKSMELRKGGDASVWLFMAMTQWRLGDKDEARKWYEKAVQWLDANAKDLPWMSDVRAEAAALIGKE